MAERERGPTRDPPQPMLTDMGPPSSNGGGPDATDDTEEELHRLSVYEKDPPRERKAMHNNRCIEPIQLIGLYRGGAIDRVLICLNKMIALPHTLLLMMHLYPNRLAVGVNKTKKHLRKFVPHGRIVQEKRPF